MKNMLFTNVGRRSALLRNFKQSLAGKAQIFASDNWAVASGLFFADEYVLTPRINEPSYMDFIFHICEQKHINSITSLIDPEISLLAHYRNKFLEKNIYPFGPTETTADLCFDKFKMYNYLKYNGIPTVLTFDSISSFEKALNSGEIAYPVFAKPRSGSGSVGAQKINNKQELLYFCTQCPNYIIQEFMPNKDIDIDVYVDTISCKPISIFTKKKIETRIGGTSKSYSFKDNRLFEFVEKVLSKFKCYGPTDIEVFEKNGEYVFSEMNPRFSGAYLHAFGAGVDFPKMMLNNLNGKENVRQIGNYENDIVMIMYDDVFFTKMSDLRGDWRD